MLAPDVAVFERLHAAARGHLQIITLAPELPGAMELIKAATQAGVTVAVGHTDATADVTLAAIDAGATHVLVADYCGLVTTGAYSEAESSTAVADLFAAVRRRSLPPWAADLDAASWGQLALKFIVSHPAVTCAIPATGNLAHLRDNLGGGRGRLPEAAQRELIARAFA